MQGSGGLIPCSSQLSYLDIKKKKKINFIFARQSVGRIQECVTVGVSFLDSVLDEYIFLKPGIVPEFLNPLSPAITRIHIE